MCETEYYIEDQHILTVLQFMVMLHLLLQPRLVKFMDHETRLSAKVSLTGKIRGMLKKAWTVITFCRVFWICWTNCVVVSGSVGEVVLLFLYLMDKLCRVFRTC